MTVTCASVEGEGETECGLGTNLRSFVIDGVKKRGRRDRVHGVREVSGK